MVNGEPSPSRVVWRSIVDVRGVKVAIAKLKEINWLYKEIDADDIDNVAKKVIESVNNTGSSMLQKASKEDISGMQAYTIRTMNEKHSITSDIEQLLLFFLYVWSRARYLV